MEQFCGRGGPLLEMSSEALSPGQLSPFILKYSALEITPLALLASPLQKLPDKLVRVFDGGSLEHLDNLLALLILRLDNRTRQQLQGPPPCSNCNSLNCTPSTVLSNSKLCVTSDILLTGNASSVIQSPITDAVLMLLYWNCTEVLVKPTSLPPMQGPVATESKMNLIFTT